MNHNRFVGILGMGAYVPEKKLTNFDLEKIVDTSDEWIQTRTGIRERRIAEKGTPTSDLASKASLAALADAHVRPEDLDLIICATITPDMMFPATACVVQHKIGAKCPAFDLSAACSGFPYALTVAEGLVRAGSFRKILVIGAEVLSSFINWKDRSTCVLFGDGAGAAIVGEVENGHGIISTYLGADGSLVDILKIPGGGSAIPTSIESLETGKHFMHMEGQDVFKSAVRAMENAVNVALKRAKIEINDVACLIPHQANIRILKAVADRVGIPEEKMFINVDRYGNMSAASTPVALYEAVQQNKIKKGDYVVLVAFGGGLTWASCVIKW